LIRNFRELYKFGLFCGILKRDYAVEQYWNYMEAKFINICPDSGPSPAGADSRDIPDARQIERSLK
jgi:hypothetical protein